MKSQLQIRKEIQHQTDVHKAFLAKAESIRQKDKTLSDLYSENAILVRGRILAMQWVIR